MTDFKFTPSKNLGKVSTSKANAANRNIKRIADSSKSDDQKAREISAEFKTAYAGTGLDMSQAVNPKFVKDMLKKGQIPEVSDKAPEW
ncbi:hypothetical protein [Corynebacterium gallinarum]|uniref:Uncharacterized protein n=1 Tax=Corynebacterium gallinarum TaxID=2762214 RepID=A0A8I0HH99_9CORY|nr:hypothetical protein [Corynebacterium gallinarum]MBD8028990.1 hypothetical protein [Corynebacterium gallinarum]